MKISVNAKQREITSDTLSAALVELGFTEVAVATALNGSFVPRRDRDRTPVQDGDNLEVLAPMKGG